MSKLTTPLTNHLYEYMLDTWLREPEVMMNLRNETAELEMSVMQISPDQAQFMAFLVNLMDARRIIEIGTFTGYSALAMALATHDNASIVCCDISEEWTNIARKYWEKAEIENKIDLRLAPALDTLKQLVSDSKGKYDFIFIDADKTNYDHYYEFSLDLLRSGGVIAVDNVFWSGAVADNSQQDDDTIAIRALNKKLHNDDRIDLSIVPIGDGLTLARKR